MFVVINNCFGGFGLSHDAIMRYAELEGLKLYPFIDDGRFGDNKYKPYVNSEKAFFISYSKKPLNEDGTYVGGSLFSEGDIKRDNPNLVKVVKEMKEKANGDCADLKIVEIPDNVEYAIYDYDGMESIHEKHRSW